MAIRIIELLSEEGSACWARLVRADREVVALVTGSLAELSATVGMELPTEIDFERVEALEGPSSFDDEDSGIVILNMAEGLARIAGRIHSVTEFDDGSVVADVYIANGDDFVAVDGDELGDVPARAGQGVVLDVKGLRFYPTWV